MPVPGTQDIRRALLEILKVGNPQSLTAKQWMTLAAKHLGITALVHTQESKEFKDRLHESLQYLTREHMISKLARNTYMITKNGQNMLRDEAEIPKEELDALPAETQEAPEPPETLTASEQTSELDALPDELDLAGDDADVTPESQEAPETPETPAASEQTSELDTLPDELDLAGDDADVTPESQEVPEIPETLTASEQTPELDALPDDLDLAGDDAPIEGSCTPEDSDSFTDTPDLQDSEQNTFTITDIDAENNIDAENSIDSDSDTLNSIDEVDPDMPKDDLPADDFSTTEDFSSAVNQALNIEDVFDRHNSELADKVLMRAAGLSQEMFAVFVTDLLSKMGYNAFQTARYTSDSEGSSMIQGVILDPKAKNPIYIHADKLSPGGTVGRSDMQDFADELAEKGGTGIFATTGEFSEQASIYAQDERIMLIDGKKLASLMLANNFCVNVAKVFEVKELDEDSFSEYE